MKPTQLGRSVMTVTILCLIALAPQTVFAGQCQYRTIESHIRAFRER